MIRMQVEHLPGDRATQDLWLGHTAPSACGFDLDLRWKTYLRAFDIEHTSRLLKAVLVWRKHGPRPPGKVSAGVGRYS